MDEQLEKLNSVIISSRIRLARNFDCLPFPHKLNDERAFNVVMKQVLNSISSLEEFRILTTKNLDFQTRSVMFEKHLLTKKIVANPEYSAIILNGNQTISILINEEDHIREQCILKGLKLVEAFEKLSKIDDSIISQNKIAFSEKLGFLTSSISNLGTGLRASVMLFLPALTLSGKIKSVYNLCSDLNLTIRGANGEGSLNECYLYQISNSVSLGVSENDIIKNVEMSAKKIASNELQIRSKMIKSEQNVLADLCWRAFGILRSAYVLSNKEFNNLIGKVKFGQDINVLKFKDNKIIDSLYELAQASTFITLTKTDKTGVELDKFRAEYLRKILEGSIII